MSDGIQPGPCPSEGCPAPTEIVCIKVDKVFDSCFQTDLVSVSTTALTVTTASLTGVTFSCAVASGTVSLGSTPPDATGCVNVIATIPFTVTFTSSTSTITFTPVTGQCTSFATLYAPTGTTFQVESSLVCSTPVATITPVTLDLSQVVLTTVVTCCVVVKSTLLVQLLVPSYGQCEVPQCGVRGLVCPPPTPPQVYPSPCR